ncbi:hypothetical protein C358_04172 [Cryptococcus neoformans MW-RSA852]|nr:hypothetical protein C358_04172 [Cryptococcus neoformans var. grubii MW-RSA852]
MPCLGMTPSSRCPGGGHPIQPGKRHKTYSSQTYLLIATSSFSKHSAITTIAVVLSIMAAVARPSESRHADFGSRPAALLMASVFNSYDFIAVAASKGMTDAAADEILYTIGNTGISGGD